MSNKPYVGIVLVNYNGALDTIECIESIDQMPFNKYKIIVVDNNSSDNSVELLTEKKTEKNFELVVLKENNGFSAGNNAGIRVAKELDVDYILLLNNDTLVKSDFLLQLLEAAVKLPEGSVLTSTIYDANSDKLWYAKGEFHRLTAKVTQIGIEKRELSSLNGSIPVSFISGCCMLIPIATLELVGELDESYFLYEEDVDFCCRILQKQLELYYVPDSIIYHKISSSTTKTKKTSAITQYYMFRNKFIFIKRHYKGIRKVIPYLHSILMYTYYCFRYGMSVKNLLIGVYDFLLGQTFKSNRKL